MKKFTENNEAFLNPAVDCIIALGIIVIMYSIFAPLMWYIVSWTIGAGAPAGIAMSYMNNFNWGFMIFAGVALLLLLAWIYHRIFDTKQEQLYKF
jgi:membrane protein implicated in regulation of membrane protease activity